MKMNLKFNPEKCKIVKFRNKGKGRYRKDDVMEIDGKKIDFVSEFCYLGVTFQASGLSFSKHIQKRVRASIFSMLKLNALPRTSVDSALKLFDLAIAPVASYGIEILWNYLDKNDLYKLESVKSRFLKKLLSLSKYTKSRFTYKLVETDLFINDLMNRFSLNSDDNKDYDKFKQQKEFAFWEIDAQFYDTPAFKNTSWKETNCKDRHIFTRFACHGFHYLLCKNKVFHTKVNDNCICEKCDEKCDTYHFLVCSKNEMTLSQAATKKI